MQFWYEMSFGDPENDYWRFYANDDETAIEFACKNGSNPTEVWRLENEGDYDYLIYQKPL